MTEESCLIIAGEKSGEEHGLTFLPELMRLKPGLRFFGVGGNDFKKLKVECLYDLKDFSSMGFSEVIFKIPFYFKAFNHLLNEVDKRKTKFAILIDFQDFNLRLAIKLKAKGVKVYYYIAPQAWGWKPGRAKKIADCAQALFCILPFEKKWFSDRGVKQVYSIAHPIHERFKNSKFLSSSKKWSPQLNVSPHILILPGSRKSEVRSLLPVLIETVKKLKLLYPKAKFGIVQAESIPENWLSSYQEYWDLHFEDKKIDEALAWADLSLAASGTVTLITAYFSVPTIVIYKSSLLNEFIFNHLIKYQGFISLANIILGKRVFFERIQKQASSKQLVQDFKMTIDQKNYNDIISSIIKLPHLLNGELHQVGQFIATDMDQIK